MVLYGQCRDADDPLAHRTVGEGLVEREAGQLTPCTGEPAKVCGLVSELTIPSGEP